MNLIVEDGSAVVNANAYVSVDEADAYFTDRNQTIWSDKTQQEKELAIANSTLFIDSQFNWKGYVVDNDQSLSWPRSYVTDHNKREIDSNIIPQRLKDAVCLLALEFVQGVNPFSSNTEKNDTIKKTKVGPIEIEFFDKDIVKNPIPEEVKALLKGLHKSNNFKNSSVEITR